MNFYNEVPNLFWKGDNTIELVSVLEELYETLWQLCEGFTWEIPQDKVRLISDLYHIQMLLGKSPLRYVLGLLATDELDSLRTFAKFERQYFGNYYRNDPDLIRLEQYWDELISGDSAQILAIANCDIMDLIYEANIRWMIATSQPIQWNYNLA